MRKIYTVLSCMFLVSTAIHAQTILTQANNEPIAGEAITKIGYDSTGTVPKNTGAGLTWNFASYTQNTVSTITSYSAPAAVSGSALFTGVTLVEKNGSSGDLTMWKSATTPSVQLEMLGLYNSTSGVEINMSSDPIVSAVWPVAFNYSLTDVGSGTVSISTNTGVVNGTVTTLGSGTGTVILPGNVPFNDVLQIKTTSTLHVVAGTAPTAVTLHVVGTDYSYYHTSQKYPVVTVSYENSTISSILGPTVTTTAKVEMNNAVFTGLTDLNFDATYQIYPNPTNNMFALQLSNSANETGRIEIYNALGKSVKQIELGNSSLIKTQVDISDLPNGIYIVRTNLGNKTSSRKLIKN